MRRVMTGIFELFCRKPRLQLSDPVFAKPITERGRLVSHIESPMRIEGGKRNFDRLLFVKIESGECVIVVMPQKEVISKGIGKGTRVDVRYKKIGRNPAFGAEIIKIYPQEANGVLCQR